MLVDVNNLDQLPLNKRLHLMEALIASFAKEETQLEAPAWHLEELQQRQAELNNPACWKSLEEVKKTLRP